MRNVLAFTPAFRLRPETVQSLFALEWEGDIAFLLQLLAHSGNPHEHHLRQYQRGREAFLRGEYDAMLIIESDIIIPPDALTRLAALDCDVAYGCYVYRGGMVTNLLERYKPYPEEATNPGESLSIRHMWKAALQQGVIDCAGSGLGCILVKREVIEAIPFADEMTYGYRQFMDYPWTEAVYRAGYRMRADCDVQCGHIDRDGAELWLARG